MNWDNKIHENTKCTEYGKTLAVKGVMLNSLGRRRKIMLIELSKVIPKLTQTYRWIRIIWHNKTGCWKSYVTQKALKRLQMPQKHTKMKLFWPLRKPRSVNYPWVQKKPHAAPTLKPPLRSTLTANVVTTRYYPKSITHNLCPSENAIKKPKFSKDWLAAARFLIFVTVLNLIKT